MKKTNKMLRVLTAIILMGSIIFTSCQKQPRASFTLSVESGHTGDKVTCKNTSLDGYSFIWTSPNGNTYTSRDLDITMGTTIGDRVVKLEAFSKNGKKMSECSHVYTVLDGYNKSFAGTYNGNSGNDLFINQTIVTTNGSDKITIDGGFGIPLDFTITSSTVGNLVPKLVTQYPDTYNFKSGTVTRYSNGLTISLVFDYTDATNSANNVSNFTITDSVLK